MKSERLNLGDVARGVEHPVGRRERPDALGHAGERVARLTLGRAPRLQQHQRRDHLEVVLDPVIDLVEQSRLLLERRLQVGGALADLTLQLIVGAANRLLDGALVGHVGLCGEEERDLTFGVSHRVDGHAVPEGRPVLAIIQELALDRLGRVDGSPQACDLGRVRSGPLKHPAIAAQQLRPIVARQLQERVVDPDDRIAVVRRIRQQHRRRARIERPSERRRSERVVRRIAGLHHPVTDRYARSLDAWMVAALDPSGRPTRAERLRSHHPNRPARTKVPKRAPLYPSKCAMSR